MVVIGIDPGSTKGHGVAVYRDGKLTDLFMASHESLRKWIIAERAACDSIVFSIENVLANKGVWHAQNTDSKAAAAATGRRIGMLQYSQAVLMEMLEVYGIPYILQKPASEWKKGASAKQFKMVTGWEGKSNEDTRSAAYFGAMVANVVK